MQQIGRRNRMGPLALSPVLQIALPLIGFVLARLLSRLDDRSLAAACLFVFLPAVIFRLSMGLAPLEHQFSFILFFMLFHTAVLFASALLLLNAFGAEPPLKHACLAAILIVSLTGLRRLQPLWPELSDGVQAVNTLIVFHLMIAATLGVFLCAGGDRWMKRFTTVLSTPYLYLFAIGIVLAGMKIELPYPWLESVDVLFSMAAPMALLIAGLMFGRHFHFLQIDQYLSMLPALGFCIIFRLIVSPLLALLIVLMMGIDDIHLKRALVLASAAPVGVFAAILAAFFMKPNEKRFSIVCVILCLAASYASTPLVEWAIDYYLPVAVEG